MIYLVGGAPRTGKSILGQRISARLKVGWVSTDLLVDLLRVKKAKGVETEWNAAPEAIRADEGFNQFPGRSRGYEGLPEEVRRQIVRDVPLWSEFIRQECERFGYPYVDMVGDFAQRLHEADAVLTTGV